MLEITENIQSALAQFQGLMVDPSQDIPAIVLVEGGKQQERLDTAALFHSIAEKNHLVIDVDLRGDLNNESLGDDQRSLNTIITTIRRLIDAQQVRPNRTIVFLYNYDRAYQIDDRIRPFLIEQQRVFGWVIISRRLLSESSDAGSGGRFRGYRNDDRVGRVIVARLKRTGKGIVQRTNSTRKTITSNTDNLSNVHSPPTRQQIDAALRAREGQAEFRCRLLKVFEDKCVVTGCTVKSLLEAAHIEPYSEGQDHRIGNGLVLRTDIHTLFDKGLLTIAPLRKSRRGRILIADVVKADPTYGRYEAAFIDLPEEGADERHVALGIHFEHSHVLD